MVAMQIEKIMQAKRMNLRKFSFPGSANEIGLIKTSGYFITYNPGYAGRQECPENLKVLFRGVSMMVPQSDVIIKVKLASVGYNQFEAQSKKFAKLYELCKE